MSFLPINEQNQQAPSGQTTNAPQGTGTPPPQQSGGSVGGGASGGAKGAPNIGSPAQFGSSASKLGDYLSSNAPQIGQQANTIAGTLNDQYGQLNQGITDAANQFGQQVQGGYAASNPNLVNQAISNPTGFVQDPNNVSGFQAQYNDQYTGPQNFESTTPYSQIQGDVSKAVQQAGLLNTQPGLQSYLQGQGKNPTQASSTLDSLLLTGNPEAKQTVSNAASQFNNLTGQLQNATNTGNQAVQNAQKSAQDTQMNARSAFNPYVANFGNTLNTNAANAEAGRTAYNTNQANTYNQLTPIQQYLQQYLGGSGVTLGSNPLEPYLNNQPIDNPITAQNFSTPEQYQQAAAIQQLLGGSGQLPIDQTTVNQAGTASQVPTLPGYDMRNLVQGLTQNAYDATNQQGKFTGTNAASAPWETLLGELQQYDPYQFTQGTGATGIGNAPGDTGEPNFFFLPH